MSLKRVSSSTAVSNLHRMKIYLDTCVVRFSQSERRQWLKRTETVNLYGKQQEVEIVFREESHEKGKPLKMLIQALRAFRRTQLGGLDAKMARGLKAKRG